MPKGRLGKKLFIIRQKLGQVQGKKKISMRQLEALFNSTPPLNITTTWSDIWKYENDKADPPGSKWDKFLSLDPEIIE